MFISLVKKGISAGLIASLFAALLTLPVSANHVQLPPWEQDMEATLSANTQEADPISDKYVKLIFTLNQKATVSLKIHREPDVPLVATILENEVLQAGQHFYSWDIRNVPTGNYRVILYTRANNGTMDNEVLNVFVKSRPEPLPPTSPVMDVSTNVSNSINEFRKDTYLYITLNQPAYVSATVNSYPQGTQGGSYPIETFISNKWLPVGETRFTWFAVGPVDQGVKDGLYSFKVSAKSVANGTSDKSESFFNVKIEPDPPVMPLMDVSGLSISNNISPQNPSTTIRFNLNQDAYVTLDVTREGSSTPVRQLMINQFVRGGDQAVIWTGNSDRNEQVASGSYFVAVRARSSANGTQDNVRVSINVTRLIVVRPPVVTPTPVPFEDCVLFNPWNVSVRQTQPGVYTLVEGSHWIESSQSSASANEKLQAWRRHGFNQICFVGRPDPSMVYFKG